MTKNFTLIVNPKSSSYDPITISFCREIFENNDCSLTIKEIPQGLNKNFIPCLKYFMLDAFLEGSIPLSCGGDGTFSAMQRSYVELCEEQAFAHLIKEGVIEKPIVGHLAMGASNDMGVNLGFSKGIEDYALELINGESRPRDIVLVNDVPMGYSAIGGLAAHIPYSTPTKWKKAQKVWAYIRYGVYDSFVNSDKFFNPLFKPYSMKITLDDEEPFFEKAHITGVFKGIQFAGLPLLASDEMCDGKFNYISVKNPVDLGFKITQGLTPGWTIDGVKRASKVEIDFIKHKPDYPFDLDGEEAPFDAEDGICAKVYQHKLNIITPKRP